MFIKKELKACKTNIFRSKDYLPTLITTKPYYLLFTE
jgi:hypothetical protein